jgi:hypothetical protein
MTAVCQRQTRLHYSQLQEIDTLTAGNLVAQKWQSIAIPDVEPRR